MLGSLRSPSHLPASSLRSLQEGQTRTLAEAAAWSPYAFHRRAVRADRTAAGRRFRDGVGWAAGPFDALWFEQPSGLALACMDRLGRVDDPGLVQVLARQFKYLLARVRSDAPANVVAAVNQAVDRAGGVEWITRREHRDHAGL